MSKQYVLRREVSDHCALVVNSVEKDWGPKPFRSIDAWFLEKVFNKMVKDKWQAYSVHDKCQCVVFMIEKNEHFGT